MLLYLVQHALANSKDIDPERGISEAGREETVKTADFLSGLNPDIPRIWRSDKKRSLETAEVLSGELGIPECVEQHSSLNPMDPVLPVKKELEGSDENIMIVGHLPWLGNLLSALLQSSDKNPVLQFRNSGIVCLERKDGAWKVLWAVTPEIL